MNWVLSLPMVLPFVKKNHERVDKAIDLVHDEVEKDIDDATK